MFIDTFIVLKGKSSHGKYGDCVEEMDWGVGVITAALDRLGITNNTVVYFTSDHGGHIEEIVDSNGGYNGLFRGRISRLLQKVQMDTCSIYSNHYYKQCNVNTDLRATYNTRCSI